MTSWTFLRSGLADRLKISAFGNDWIGVHVDGQAFTVRCLRAGRLEIATKLCPVAQLDPLTALSLARTAPVGALTTERFSGSDWYVVRQTVSLARLEADEVEAALRAMDTWIRAAVVQRLRLATPAFVFAAYAD